MSKSDALHAHWDDLPSDQPMPTITRRRVIGNQAMISHVRLEEGCFVPTHAHDNEQFVCVLSGALRFRLGPADQAERRTLIVRGGEVLHLPSNVPHEAEALEESIVLDVFSPPSTTTGIDRPAGQ